MYIKLDNNIVVQKQCYPEKGFIECHDDVVCGMIHDGSEKFGEDNFSSPAPVTTWDDIRLIRSVLLTEADYLVNTAEDNGIDTTSYRSYRQSLRDITELYESPDLVVWPQKPE